MCNRTTLQNLYIYEITSHISDSERSESSSSNESDGMKENWFPNDLLRNILLCSCGFVYLRLKLKFRFDGAEIYKYLV